MTYTMTIHAILMIVGQPVAMRLDQIIHELPYLLQVQLCRGVRVEHGGLTVLDLDGLSRYGE